MAPEEFGMWGLAVLAWVVALYSALFAHAYVREYIRAMWLEHQLRLRYLDKVDGGEEDPFN